MAAGPLGQWDSLPYAELKGPGLERLCFRLLLADRKAPRYFGDNGEAQFGIDLIVSNGNDCTVFQCKNHANFEIGEFKALLAKFEQEWLLARPELPKPVELVVIWPVMHTERQDVETVKKDFFERTGVRVEIWHRDILDHRLRDLPDIVADLFSLHAVQRFCTRQNWDADIFRPLEPNSGDRRAVGRFLDLLRDNRVVLDPSAVERFDEILGSQAVAILSGASGSGKTITSLALAKGFDDGAWRVFYINLRQQMSEQQLVNGVRHRSISPTVFIFDDAHLNLDLVQRTIDRLADILGDRWVRIAVVMQAAGIGSDDYDGPIQDFIEECTTGKAVIELVATEARYAAIVARSRPDLRSLSDERLRRLVALSGRSLSLLDEVLPLFATVDDLDTVDLEQIFPLVLRRYFKKEQGGVSAPALKRLAGLGQFDLVVPVEDLPDPFEPRWQEAVDRLTVTLGRPESRAFFHPSVAEMLFRTLSWADGDNDWIEAAAKVWVARLGSACAINPVELQLFLRSRLRLADDLPLKQQVLCDKTLLATFEKGRGELRVEWLSLMVRLTRAVEPEPPFAAWLMDQIVRMVAEPTNVGTGSVGTLGLAFRELGLRDPEQTQLRKLEEQIDPGALLALLRERADLSAFLNVLQCTSVEFAGRLVRALDPLTVAALLQHTRDRQASVGTLSFALRELGLRDPEQTQLRELEAKIGLEALLALLRERADLSAFLKVLQYTSVEFAGRLIRALDPLTVAAFLRHTLDRQASVGTLNFALRELGLRDPEQMQLRELEDKIGPDALLWLLRERADLSAFLRVLQYTSVEFAGRLIRALDPPTVAALLQRTRDRQGSVGAALAFAFRELGLRDPEQTQLRQLEDKIGSDALLALLRERADLSAFLGVVQRTSVEFAGRLIQALDPPTVAALLQRTRDRQGSVGAALAFALRELGLRDPQQTQLRQLEDKIGSDTLLGLLRERADLAAFLRVVQHTSVEFAGRLIGALDPSAVAALLQRTRDQQVSVGTLGLILREIGLRDPQQTQLRKLEDKIGSDALLGLLRERADLSAFLSVLQHTSVEFAGRLIRALDPLTVAALLQHTRDQEGSVGTLGLALRELGLRDPEQTQLRELEDKIGPGALLGLLRERADLSSFFKILANASVEFAGRLIWALDRGTMAQFIDRTIILGSSVGTIALPIGYLRRHLPECADRLDSMIGPDNLWRLFVSNGDLNDLSPLLPALGRPLRDAFISLEHGSECRWRDLTARSNFYAICRFARDCFSDLPEIVGCRLAQVIKASVTGSLQRTRWSEFSSSRTIIEKLVPSDLKGCLMEAAGDRIARLGPDDLRAEDMGTASSLLLTVQHHRPDLWPIAARDFWRIVPPESTWPDDYHRLIAGRFLLQLASLPEVSKRDAERVILAFTTRPPTLNDAESKVVWLFLWNLFATWYERGRPFSDRFRGLQPPEFWDKLVQFVKQQVHRHRNEDKLNLLIVAGLLRFLVPETAQVLRSELKGRLTGIRYLLNKTDELTMLPAFFALQGISLLVPQRDVFTPERRRVLVEKASEYPQRGAALDLVCGWLRNEI